MKTKVLTEKEVDEAALLLKNGGVVAIPTETVYGLAANAFDVTAVSKIFKAKGRPMDNPLIVHISDIEEIHQLVLDFPCKAQKLCSKFWPGPLTIILPKSKKIPNEVSAGLETVAIRLPSHELARNLIKKAGIPLAAPSANISGKPSPTTASHVFDDMNGKIDAILDGGTCSVGLESTVITLTTDPPTLLRPGGITLEQLESEIGEVALDDAVLKKVDNSREVLSPGMKYKHYAPNAKVIILECSREKFIDYVNHKSSENVAALCYNEDVESIKVKTFTYGSYKKPELQARTLFDALRDIDKDESIKIVYAICPQKNGIGMAVYNRLIRAAGFEVLNV